MKIAILGTRGIPNNYGGFEQFAEYLSKGLVQLGHEVYVYCGSDHIYKEKTWHGVHLIHQPNPEGRLGTAGQFFYDLFCILNSRRQKFDLILQLGYTSNSIWGRLLPSQAVVVTNMDGLEWRRSKYSKKVQTFLKYAEKLAVKTSDFLIADSLGIKSYLKQTYQVEATYIPYGTDVVLKTDERILKAYGVEANSYNLLIARMEPENNIEVILDGYINSNTEQPILIIGNANNTFGLYLKDKFKSDNRIKFIGPNYDMVALNNLRYFSKVYFHGHSVGGTNPSLLEAMGSGAFICAHDNEFNKAILGEDAFYFKSNLDVRDILNSNFSKVDKKQEIENNFAKVNQLYRWPLIISAYESYFQKVLSSRQGQ